MNETLRLLYDRFYIPLPMAESEQEVETCHRQLIERLDKPERKLVLRIIDAQNLMIRPFAAVFAALHWGRECTPPGRQKRACGRTEDEGRGLLQRRKQRLRFLADAVKINCYQV